ncbi:MAG: hypothetical protein KKB57_10200, partial [Proteobacteria bacterium]|nr:hypothetical protein [Pseudomonadota bacterium]
MQDKQTWGEVNIYVALLAQHFALPAKTRKIFILGIQKAIAWKGFGRALQERSLSTPRHALADSQILG